MDEEIESLKKKQYVACCESRERKRLNGKSMDKQTKEKTKWKHRQIWGFKSCSGSLFLGTRVRLLRKLLPSWQVWFWSHNSSFGRIKNAFLNCKLQEIIFMRQPKYVINHSVRVYSGSASNQRTELSNPLNVWKPQDFINALNIYMYNTILHKKKSKRVYLRVIEYYSKIITYI